MDKKVLMQYCDAKARIKLLRDQAGKKRRLVNKLTERDYVASDFVFCGKRGKKPLGTARISRRLIPSCEEAEGEYEKQYNILQREEQELLKLQTRVEEYISGLADVKMRNIMTLYYADDLNWQQVANQMNRLYPKNSKCYIADSCRCRHDRFLE